MLELNPIINFSLVNTLYRSLLPHLGWCHALLVLPLNSNVTTQSNPLRHLLCWRASRSFSMSVNHPAPQPLDHLHLIGFPTTKLSAFPSTSFSKCLTYVYLTHCLPMPHGSFLLSSFAFGLSLATHSPPLGSPMPLNMSHTITQTLLWVGISHLSISSSCLCWLTHIVISGTDPSPLKSRNQISSFFLDISTWLPNTRFTLTKIKMKLATWVPWSKSNEKINISPSKYILDLLFSPCVCTTTLARASPASPRDDSRSHWHALSAPTLAPRQDTSHAASGNVAIDPSGVPSHDTKISPSHSDNPFISQMRQVMPCPLSDRWDK